MYVCMYDHCLRYYEVLLKTSGYMRVGWCTLNLAVTSVPGTDEHAFVYDGFQVTATRE